MGIDLGKMAAKAIETALDDGQSQRRSGHTMRALAAGAALAVGARAAMSRGPGLLQHLPDLSELRDIPDRVRDRMEDAGWLDDEPEIDDEDVEEPEAAAGEDFDEEEPEEDDSDDEEPDEDLDDEEPDEDEPEAEGDEDFEDEDEDEDDFDDEEPEAEADEDFDEEDEELESDDEEEEPPELELESDDDEDLHPEDRPPKPPKAASRR
jgi:hypothetical protein